jgi:tRNA(fMet)-specific endonuclease VapC
MLDTSICAHYMRKRSQAITDRLQAAVLAGAELAISVIVYSELLDGVMGKNAAPKHADLLREFLERIDSIIAWDQAAVQHTAQIRMSLRVAGTPIGPNDSAIAGHALALGATFVTNKVSEFSRVAGLRVEDWTIPAPL